MINLIQERATKEQLEEMLEILSSYVKLELLEVSGVLHGNNETAIAYWNRWHIASPNAR
ncbi:hypothetical protein [Kamptonema sp. UHCC 0994]|uniref:hypothetical protein n=1 Tax=Kamptonema sp. UHCC 0994 TaxID=3031329 RepID=UPI0023BAA50F|nr:hypothetical protein [Kamptonema sp. UHCC 0994]MDF0556318.1 hypothetical protein [Kamptonema sp. UHCC 0994]